MNARPPDSGRRFREAMDALTERMSANPQQFPIAFKSVRRALLRRFPYALFFAASGDTLLVIACFHAQPRSLALAKAHLNFTILSRR